jgi:hypothetical protein
MGELPSGRIGGAGLVIGGFEGVMMGGRCPSILRRIRRQPIARRRIRGLVMACPRHRRIRHKDKVLGIRLRPEPAC